MPEETGPYGVVLARGRVDERLVPKVGIEPTLGFPNQILSLARLPVSPLRRQPSILSIGSLFRHR